jgi:hypothetical protein
MLASSIWEKWEELAPRRVKAAGCLDLVSSECLGQ